MLISFNSFSESAVFLDSAMVKKRRISGKFERLVDGGGGVGFDRSTGIFLYMYTWKIQSFSVWITILGPNLLSKDPGRVILPLPGVGGMSPNMLLPLCET